MLHNFRCVGVALFDKRGPGPGGIISMGNSAWFRLEVIMESVMKFKTANGRMVIYPDKFFPATKREIKELLKIINHPVTGDGNKKILECIDYLEEQLHYLKEDEVEYSDLYVVMEEPIANEFSFYYYSQRNKLIVKIMEMIKAKKSKYQSNIEQLKGGLIS